MNNISQINPRVDGYADTENINRIALISVHGCPTGPVGNKDTGGMSVYILKVAEELSRLGVYVDIFTRYHDPEEPETVQVAERAKVVHLKAGTFWDPKSIIPTHLPVFLCKILEYVEQNQISYDLLHSHYWLSGRIANVLAHHWEIPHVTSFHTLGEVKNLTMVGEKEPFERITAERRIIQTADSIVAFSRGERDAMISLYEGAEHKIQIIPCGVDTNIFAPSDPLEAKRNLGLEDESIVLYVGRLEPLKGVDILLKSLTRLKAHAQVRTIIVGGDRGNDPEMHRLMALSDELGISGQVSYVGRVDHTLLPTYYNAADICVMPSYSESFGMVALEAMACGTPVIASNVGGLKDIVKDGVTGYLITDPCPDAYANSLDALLSNAGTREAMSQASRQIAKTMEWHLVSEKLLNCYRRLVTISN